MIFVLSNYMLFLGLEAAVGLQWVKTSSTRHCILTPDKHICRETVPRTLLGINDDEVGITMSGVYNSVHMICSTSVQ